MAKVVMAELAHTKLENMSWPRGTHSLRYHYLDLSEPGPSLPTFLAVGYVDDQPSIRYDSLMDKAKAQAPWIKPMNAQYWENETMKQRKWAEIHQVETWTEACTALSACLAVRSRKMATPTASGSLAMMGKTTCHWTWKL